MIQFQFSVTIIMKNCKTIPDPRVVSQSGRWSRNSNFMLQPQPRHLKFLAPAPERFAPLKTENHCIICTTRLHHKLCLWNCKPNFSLGRKTMVQGTSSHKLKFWQAVFAPLAKWRPWHDPCLPYPRYTTDPTRWSDIVIKQEHSLAVLPLWHFGDQICKFDFFSTLLDFFIFEKRPNEICFILALYPQFNFHFVL